jgi:hypothetical protein
MMSASLVGDVWVLGVLYLWYGWRQVVGGKQATEGFISAQAAKYLSPPCALLYPR